MRFDYIQLEESALKDLMDEGATQEEIDQAGTRQRGLRTSSFICTLEAVHFSLVEVCVV